jgi:clan AA aspartic protease (TIGR02281 family)
MRILFLVLGMVAALAVNAMTARHLEKTTTENAAQRILPPARTPGEIYRGDYRDGRYNGRGTLQYANGEKYTGEFRDGQREGSGTYTWPDGRRYVGQFRNGQPDGQGRYTLSNGEEYAGQFRDNRREGRGVYTWPDLRRYEGEFHNDLPNGRGQLTLASGQRQTGWFRDGAYAGEERGLPPVALPQPGEDAIKLSRDGVNFAAPVVLNGTVQSQFLVDSGAADVQVPMSIFDELLHAGTVTPADVTGFQTYRMANGTSARAVSFTIRSLQIGGIVLENVRCAAIDAPAPALLGMSFLGRFRSWALDNENETLVLTAYAR